MVAVYMLDSARLHHSLHIVIPSPPPPHIPRNLNHVLVTTAVTIMLQICMAESDYIPVPNVKDGEAMPSGSGGEC